MKNESAKMWKHSKHKNKNVQNQKNFFFNNQSTLCEIGQSAKIWNWSKHKNIKKWTKPKNVKTGKTQKCENF